MDRGHYPSARESNFLKISPVFHPPPPPVFINKWLLKLGSCRRYGWICRARKVGQKIASHIQGLISARWNPQMQRIMRLYTAGEGQDEKLGRDKSRGVEGEWSLNPLTLTTTIIRLSTESREPSSSARLSVADFPIPWKIPSVFDLAALANWILYQRTDTIASSPVLGSWTFPGSLCSPFTYLPAQRAIIDAGHWPFKKERFSYLCLPPSVLGGATGIRFLTALWF